MSEAGELGAREGHQGRDAPAALELGGGHVFHAERVVAGHVRAVAPDDAGQRRLEPPHVPRATEQTLGLPVEHAELLRVLVLETQGRLGVDVAEPEHRRDHVGADDVRRAGASGDVEIAGGVDDDLRQECLASSFGLDEDPPETPVLDDRLGEPAVQSQAHATLDHQILGDALPAVGIERDRVDDRLRLAAGAEVVAPPARPGAPHVPAHATVLGRRRHGQAELLEPLDGFADEPRRGDLPAVHHVVEQEHHAAGREPAQIRIALDQCDPRAAARRGHGGAHAGRTAAHHEHVAPVDDRRRACRFRDRRRRHQDASPCFHVTMRRSAKLTTAKKTTAQPEATNTVA